MQVNRTMRLWTTLRWWPDMHALVIVDDKRQALQVMMLLSELPLIRHDLGLLFRRRMKQSARFGPVVIAHTLCSVNVSRNSSSPVIQLCL